MPAYKYMKKAPIRHRKARPSRGKIYGAAAGQLYRDVKMIENAINVEYKVQDTQQALATVSQTPTVTLWNALQLGNDYNQRNGRQVKWTSIYQRITAQSPATATVPHYVRHVLFWYKDPSATAPTPTQMFNAGAPSINAMTNLNVRKDFIILYDKVYKIGTATGGEASAFRKIYKKCNMRTVFNASSLGTIADIESGALYSMTWSDTSTAAEMPTLTIQSRLRYRDWETDRKSVV